MSRTSPADPHRPVVDVGDLVARVDELLPVAIRPQLWALFFDADCIQLPMMVPLEGIPAHPSPAAVEAWGSALGAVVAEFEVAWIAFVVERPGAASTTGSDAAWCRSLLQLRESQGLAVRHVLGCSDAGVAIWGSAPPGSTAGLGVDGSSACGARAQASPRSLALADVLPLR